MTELLVTISMYPLFRHWIKRHGWLLNRIDVYTGIMYFISIKPVFKDLNITASFTKNDGFICFVGYEKVSE